MVIHSILPGRRNPSPAITRFGISTVSLPGRLLKEEVEWDVVPEEERPGYDEELGGFENKFEEAFGMLDRDSKGWTDLEYHGTFEFHTTIDGSYISLDAKFTDGDLVKISRFD